MPGWITSIIGLLKPISEIILRIFRFFTKTTQEKIEAKQKENEKQRERARKEGRPTW
jgi:UPF0716 family protein affecting phage T7 exclusion